MCLFKHLMQHTFTRSRGERYTLMLQWIWFRPLLWQALVIDVQLSLNVWYFTHLFISPSFLSRHPIPPSVLFHLPFHKQLWWHFTMSHRYHVIPNPPSRTTLRKKCVRPLTFTSCDKRQLSYPMSPGSPSLHQINGVIHQLRHVVALLSQMFSLSLHPIDSGNIELNMSIYLGPQSIKPYLRQCREWSTAASAEYRDRPPVWTDDLFIWSR